MTVRAAAARRPSSAPRSAAAGLLLLAGLAVGGAPAPARGDDDTQPVPPRIFFSQPDEVARQDLDELIDSSFGDLSKSVTAREVLVRRFGLWAVPPLLERIRTGSNETVLWNAILTVASLRRTYGPSEHLGVAVAPLVAILKREGSEPWRRAFAALALGTFYGPQTVRRGPASREGTEAGAARTAAALAEGDAALVAALSDANAPVSVAAALALGKIGSPAGAESRRPGGTSRSMPEAHVAELVSLGLLPGDEDARLLAGLKDSDRRSRAAAALALSCWGATELHEHPARTTVDAAGDRAARMDAALDPTQNTLLRLADVDGAEAILARALLALVSGRTEVWDATWALATTTTEARASVAAAQALLFAPASTSVRGRMAELAGRPNVGHAVREPVLAACLLVAGSDGSPAGVRACREFLRDRSREPHGRVEFDVRYHAAIGLVRALAAGRVPPEARAEAVDALSEGVRAGLQRGEGRTFRNALDDLVKPYQKALALDPAALPSPLAAAALEGAFAEPDALLARDPVDVVVNRLNAAVLSLFGLDSLPKAATSGPSGRTPSREDPQLRLLLAWLERYPYFQRLDLLPERGRVPAPPPSPRQARDLEIDK